MKHFATILVTITALALPTTAIAASPSGLCTSAPWLPGCNTALA